MSERIREITEYKTDEAARIIAGISDDAMCHSRHYELDNGQLLLKEQGKYSN